MCESFFPDTYSPVSTPFSVSLSVFTRCLTMVTRYHQVCHYDHSRIPFDLQGGRLPYGDHKRFSDFNISIVPETPTSDNRRVSEACLVYRPTARGEMWVGMGLSSTVQPGPASRSIGRRDHPAEMQSRRPPATLLDDPRLSITEADAGRHRVGGRDHRSFDRRTSPVMGEVRHSTYMHTYTCTHTHTHTSIHTYTHLTRNIQ